jgi:hypothetical protein
MQMPTFVDFSILKQLSFEQLTFPTRNRDFCSVPVFDENRQSERLFETNTLSLFIDIANTTSVTLYNIKLQLVEVTIDATLYVVE